MRNFDHAFVEEVISRLRRLEPDARPAWGALTAPEMVRHLIGIVRYATGRDGHVVFVGNWFTTNVLGKLAVRGWLPIPKNIRFEWSPGDTRAIQAPGDVETLHATMLDYLNLVQTGELQTEQHPLFGDIGVDGWDAIHVRHFEHHLRQFRL